MDFAEVLRGRRMVRHYPADPDAAPSPRLTDRRKPLGELIAWRD